MSVVERVALAMRDARNQRKSGWTGMKCPISEDEIADARAALAAMREPTEAMIAARTAADWVGECEGRAGLSIMPYTEMVPDDEAEDYALIERTLPGIWPSMIDAALGDEK